MTTRIVCDSAPRGQDHATRPSPDELYRCLLLALDRRQYGRAGELRSALSRQGYRVEQVAGTSGIRLIPPRRSDPPTSPCGGHVSLPSGPVAWFLRLVRALYDGDASLERLALAELGDLGFEISVSPTRRLGG